jgi:hypothetical protein
MIRRDPLRPRRGFYRGEQDLNLRPPGPQRRNPGSLRGRRSGTEIFSLGRNVTHWASRTRTGAAVLLDSKCESITRPFRQSPETPEQWLAQGPRREYRRSRADPAGQTSATGPKTTDAQPTRRGGKPGARRNPRGQPRRGAPSARASYGRALSSADRRFRRPTPPSNTSATPLTGTT